MSYQIIRHPRYYSKPLRCQAGLHSWETANVKGRPVLICKKCGAFIYKEVKEKTVTKKGIRKLTPKQRRPRTKEEIYEEVWEEKQRSPRR